MEPTQKETAPRRPQPPTGRLALTAGIALVVAAVAIGSYSLLRCGAEEVIVGGEPIGGAAASCIQYSDELLADQAYAFDGTLVSASPDGTEAVFEVHRWFKGDPEAEITLDAQGLTRGESVVLIGLSLEVDQRHLISGTDGFIWACDYSLTYDTVIADHWAGPFGA